MNRARYIRFLSSLTYIIVFNNIICCTFLNTLAGIFTVCSIRISFPRVFNYIFCGFINFNTRSVLIGDGVALLLGCPEA